MSQSGPCGNKNYLNIVGNRLWTYQESQYIMGDLELLIDLMCEYKSRLDVTWWKLEFYSCATMRVMRRFRFAYKSMPKLLRASRFSSMGLAKYFEETT